MSKKTVSRVINKAPYVNKKTRARVEAVIAEHGYQPDPQARGLAFRRSFLVGLIHDNPNSQYVENIHLGILDALADRGYELVIRPCDRRSPKFLDDMRSFVERLRLFGVVLIPSGLGRRAARETARERGLPIRAHHLRGCERQGAARGTDA